MPYTFATVYTCPVCGVSYHSTHYKQPKRCPDCRKAHRAKRSLANYHERRMRDREYGRGKRDRAYDGTRLGSPESVYSPQCVIHIKREVGECKCCRKVTNIINGYCPVCRGNGANEKQCMNPKGIK